MSNVITLRVPDSLHERIKKLAKDNGVSLNQYVQLALAEKLAREETLQMVEGRFNDLEQYINIMLLKRETEYDKRFQDAIRQVNGRYQLIEKTVRRYKG